VYAGLANVRVGAVGAAVAAVDTLGDDTPPNGGAPALYFWIIEDSPPSEVFDVDAVMPVGACCCRAVTCWGSAGAVGCVVGGGNG